MKPKMMFEKPESMRKEKAEDAQKVRAVKTIAKEQVKEHEQRMHKKMAAGGMVTRGGGAAKRGLRFVKNG
jgi:hypothetical protein